MGGEMGENYGSVDTGLLKEMLTAAQQLQQLIIQQLNQMEMERQRMANEVLKIQGQIELLEQLTGEKEEVQDGKIVKIPEQEAPGSQEGEPGPERDAKD